MSSLYLFLYLTALYSILRLAHVKIPVLLMEGQMDVPGSSDLNDRIDISKIFTEEP